MLPTIQWKKGKVVMVDQRNLPWEETYLVCETYEEVAEAIEKMAIRGAPAIGVAAAFGVCLGLKEVKDKGNIEEDFSRVINRLRRTRPTARNLFWALERMESTFKKYKKLNLPQLRKKILQQALEMEKEDVKINKRIGFWGRELIKDGDRVLTHCNAGALATAGYGTALGIIRAAVAQGKRIRVFVDETRPFLQGARLTCWELSREKIPFVLVTDNMAGFLMQKKMVSLVLTGADRIAQNGDTVNKIGTYTLAVLAREHRLPFYVAAPISTIDFTLKRGDEIPIEERAPQEVREIFGRCISLSNVEVYNPSFDLTPARYITAIITEEGIIRPPYRRSLLDLKNKKKREKSSSFNPS